MAQTKTPAGGSNTRNSTVEIVRQAATELPEDARHSSLVEIRHKLDCIVRAAAHASVIVPVVVGLGGSLIAVQLGIVSSAIADSLTLAGLLSGLMAYGQAIAENIRERRQLQIQLSAGTELKWADLADVDMSRSYLRERDLQGIRLSGATCYESDFSYADMRDARLTKGMFTRAVFDFADLTAAGCFRAKLTRCSFRQANLYGASMCGADLRHSDLTGADLRRSDLRRARLEHCTFDQAQLEGAWYSSSTIWPPALEPPSNQLDDPHQRVFKDDASEGLVSVTGQVPGSA